MNFELSPIKLPLKLCILFDDPTFIIDVLISELYPPYISIESKSNDLLFRV
ncbi:hypothetical protein D3C72_2215400 [compost metagenome]